MKDLKRQQHSIRIESTAPASRTQNAINHKLRNVTGMQVAPLIQQITILHIAQWLQCAGDTR